MKKSFVYISLLLLFAFVTPKITVFAAPEQTEDTEETEETEEETEEETNDDGGEWKEKDGIFTYEIENEAVKGWYKIGSSWYYFGADGIMQANTKVGSYVLDAEGKLVNGSDSEDFVPEPHGQIYNSTTAILLKDGNTDAENVVTTINDLYDSYKGGNTIEDKKIREARYSYNSLTSAEKVRVNNEQKLAEMEIAYGITYDYDAIYATRTDAIEADGSVKNGTTYTFNIDDKNQNTTIVIRYTTDANMDGVGDVPVISLISPNDETIEITNIAPQIRNEQINTSLTWTDNFTQLDIANAENGTWTVVTDIICTFEQKEYAGNRTDINPIPSEQETHSKGDAEDEPEIESEKTTINIGPIIALIVVIGAFVGFMIVIKKMNFGEDKEKKQKKNTPSAPIETKEEEYARLKAELSAMDQEYMEESFEDNDFEKPQQQENQPETSTFSQQEMIESIEEYTPSYNIYEQNTGTNILRDTDEGYYEKPVNTPNQNIPQLDAPQQTIQNSTNNADDWYEEEE